MKILTEKADLRCEHQNGVVKIQATQRLVSIGKGRVLVKPNPEDRSISDCPWTGINMKPCQKTLVVQGGYSDLITIQGRAVCLDTVWGFTEGVPAGFKYKVVDPGQSWVEEV